jgi:DNA-directed RNA polymerase alpha subunit
LLRTPNFGRKSLNEIKEVLVQTGLGMEVPGWPPKNIEELAKHVRDGDLLPDKSEGAGSRPKQPPFNPAFLKKVDELDFTVRTANCLKNDNVVYVGDLVQRTEAEMRRTPNFGRKSLNEIKEMLVQMGLYLGMEVPNWPPENIEEPAKRIQAD